MKVMKVCICVKNAKFAADLARGLAERSEKLHISVINADEADTASKTSECDVIISDEIEKKEYDPRYLLLEGMKTAACGDMYLSKGHVIDYRSPVSAILKYINEIGISSNINTVSTAEATENNIQICVLLSTMGGSGVSAAALTMGRLLASEEGRCVLYIHIGKSKSHRCYIAEVQRAIRPSAELVCMLRNGADISADSYLSKDSYGLNLIDIENGEAYILKYIIEKKLFDTVIIDASANVKPIPATKLFVFHNEKDMRARLHLPTEYKISKDISKEKCTYADETEAWRCESESCFNVYNRSSYSYIKGQEIYIADDSRSFIVTEGRVEIAHDRDYASGIRKLASLAEYDKL